MKNFKQLCILIAFVAVVFSSCSKDEAEPAATPFVPAFTSVNLNTKIPASLATKSPQTAEQVNLMISLMSLVEELQTSKTAGKANRKDSWTSGDFTINYTGSDTATQHLYSFTISQGSVTYYTINGWENISGNAGHWVLEMSATATSDIATSVDFDWTKNATNDFHLDMLIVSGISNFHIVSNINNDNSGDIAGYIGTTLSFKSVWTTTGSGQYTDYTTTPPTVTIY